jgi:hypothetical protein
MWTAPRLLETCESVNTIRNPLIVSLVVTLTQLAGHR